MTSHSKLPIIELIQKKIQKIVACDQIAGAVFRVMRGDQIIHHSVTGARRISKDLNQKLANPEPLAGGEVFDLASLTKVFGGTYAAMLAVDDGKLEWDRPLHESLSEWPSSSKVTPRHLLTHQSGLLAWYPFMIKAGSRGECLPLIICDCIESEPGGKRRYSDVNLILLCMLIERVTGLRLDKYLGDRLFHPMELKKTGYRTQLSDSLTYVPTSLGNPFEKLILDDDSMGIYSGPERSKDFAGWRERVLVGEVNDGNCFHAMESVSGHAGLFSDLDGCLALLRLAHQRGTYEGQSLISAESFSETLGAPSKQPTKQPLGWWSREVLKLPQFPEDTVGHSGFTGTVALAVPSQDLSVVFLSNRQQVGIGKDGRYFNTEAFIRELVSLIPSSQRP